MHYGGDYNPEQWMPEVWVDDVERMREAGVTLVSVGIFSWSRIQPAEGVFDWEWLDTVLDLLHEGGIDVDLATATASPPAWASARYPELLPVDAAGSTYWPGSRQHYAPTSPVYRRLAAELVTALVERYARHPAVVMWHVNNEYGCHLHYDYSDSARDAFRVWLQRRYETVDRLNSAWGTDFWSQRLGSFDEVFPPRLAPYSRNPTGLLDWKRFSSDALLELFTMERDIIRASGATQPITTNFMGMFPAADYRRWARELDFISDDNYADPNDPYSFRAAAFSRDLMRSLKPGVPWVLMEQAASAVNWRPSNAPKAPGQLAALSMQAVAHGADGVMFFQWRQSRKGSEKFHSAMLPHAGTETRTWREVVELGATLAALPPMAPDSHADVALVVDWENWWALENPDHPVVLDYAALVQRWYSALHAQHVGIDIVHPTADLSAYSLVVAPQLYLLSDEGAANLSAFANRGGHLLVSAFSDIVDVEDGFRAGGFQRGLGEVLGIQVLDFGALVAPADAAGQLGQNHAMLAGPFGEARGEYLAEELVVHDAEVRARFTSGRTNGMPALTSRGTAHYLATIPDDDGMTRVVAWALQQAGVAPELTASSPFVEFARRGDVVTAINHGTEPVTVQLEGTDIRTGEPLGEVRLDAFGWVMARV